MDAMEVERIAFALAQRLREGSLPPDDAYAWTRYVAEALRPLRDKMTEGEPTMPTPVLRWMTVFALLFVPMRAYAQTGPCPTTPIPTTTQVVTNGTGLLCFTASADHNATDPVLTTQQLVTGYSVLFFDASVDPATGAPIQTSPIGKPTPNAQNAIWVPSPAYPLGRALKAVVIATGDRGNSARSNDTGPFGKPGTAPPAAPPGMRIVP